jgi:hypothetical protein
MTSLEEGDGLYSGYLRGGSVGILTKRLPAPGGQHLKASVPRVDDILGRLGIVFILIYLVYGTDRLGDLVSLKPDLSWND